MLRPTILLALLLPFLAAACQSPPTQFLTLDPAPAAASSAAAYLGPAIRIPAVHIPPALDRVEFTRETAPGEMKVSDLVHWSAPLGLLARNTLILDLGRYLPAGRVAPPDAPAQPDDLRADVSILSFDVAGGAASMEAAYQFASDSQGAVGQRLGARLTVPSVGDSPAETARAFSALLGALASRMANDLAAMPVAAR